MERGRFSPWLNAPLTTTARSCYDREYLFQFAEMDTRTSTIRHSTQIQACTAWLYFFG